MPDTGTSKRYPVSTHEVPTQPPRHAARAARTAASTPWARRAPNSTTARPLAASTTRRAFVAIIVWNNSVDSNAVSTIWASGNEAVTRISGSPAKTGVPSGMAQTSPRNRKSRR